ncbi:MAG: serine/threonine-protein kinase, partial [Planctomycetota bacterium]
MSVVWSAHDRLLNRDVALKVIGEDHHTNPELLARFERESRVVARLQHPGIPPIYELARLPDGRPFLAMKRVIGQTLRDEGLFGRHADGVLDVFLQVCQTVAFAHSQGIVHRDLKPDNIMIGEFGEIQVMDWGIAEEVSPGEERVARKVVGTPAYMSPEQAIGLKCGRRSDVYSLGLLLCDMLTGEAHRPNELATTVRSGDQERESLVRRVGDAGIDDRLMEIIKDCVSFEPTDRPQDAAELADRVSAYSRARHEDLRQTELIHATQLAQAQQRRQRTRLGFALTGVLVVV